MNYFSSGPDASVASKSARAPGASSPAEHYPKIVDILMF